MHKTLICLLAATALSGCDQFAQIEAFAACTERIEAEFPRAQGLSDENFDEVRGIGELNLPDDFSLNAVRNDGSEIACRGNLDQRLLYEVTFQGEKASPTEVENWSY